MLVATAMAAPVDQETAMAQARAFLFQKSGHVSGQKFAPAQKTLTATPALEGVYAFNVGNGNGFVLVSGDDSAPAILGYADQGTFDASQMPPQVKSWLTSYADQIRMQGGQKPTVVMPHKIAVRKTIEPLIQSEWSQEPPYSNQLPSFFGQVSAVGCVPTAMAQVMRYYRHPAATTAEIPGYTCDRFWAVNGEVVVQKQESGEQIQVQAIPAGTQFDWDNMLMSYDAATTDAQKQAVSTLMKVNGAATKTDYASVTLGSYTANAEVENAFKQYLDYSDGISHVYRRNTTMDEWNTMLYEEIKAGRPVIMGGNSTSGAHAFVIDGYDADNYFHINWGWGGFYNGYYLLSACNPEFEGEKVYADGFSVDQDAIIGIQPNGSLNPQSIQRPMIGDILGVEYNTVSKLYEVEFNCYGNLSGIHNYYMAIGYITEADTFKVISDTERTPDLQRGAGYPSFKLPLVGLDDGTYQVVPLAKDSIDESRSNPWQCIYGDYAHNYVEVIKKGDDIQTRVVRPTVDLEATAFTPLTEPKAGKAVELAVTIDNQGDEFYGTLYLFAGLNPQEVALFGIMGVSLRNHVATTVNFVMTPPAAGNYTLYVATDAEAQNIIGQGTMTVAQSVAAAESLEVTSFSYDNPSTVEEIKGTITYEGVTYGIGAFEMSYPVINGMFAGSVHVKNNSAADFDGPFVMMFVYTDDLIGSLFFGKGWGQLDGYVVVEGSLDAGQEADIPFQFPGMLPSDLYYIPVLMSAVTGKQLSQVLPDYVVRFLPGAITYDTAGTIKGVEVKETMEFDANTIAVEFDQVEGLNTVTAANPNMLYFFDADATVPEALKNNVVKGDVAESLVLQDGYPFATPYAFDAQSVSFSRQFTPALTTQGAGWETIALPFDVQEITVDGTAIDWYREADNEDAEKFRLAELAEENGTELVFKSAGSFKAATPYLIGFPVAAGKNLMTVVFSSKNVTIDPEIQPISFTGHNFVMSPSFEDKKVEGAMVLNAAGTAFEKTNGDVRSFRGYVVKTTLSDDLGAAQIQSNTLVGVQGVAAEGMQPAGDWYTVSGQRVLRPAKSGIYIRSGKKAVVK